MKALLMAITLPLVAGCSAMLPKHLTVVETTASGNVVEFERCRVQVTFSGTPGKLPIWHYRKLVGGDDEAYFDFAVAGWHYPSYRLTERAACICRDVPLTGDDTQSWINRWHDNDHYRLVGRSTKYGLGLVVEIETKNQGGALAENIRFIYPKSAPGCFAMVAVRSPSARSEGARFLAAVRPLITPRSDGDTDPTPPAMPRR